MASGFVRALIYRDKLRERGVRARFVARSSPSIVRFQHGSAFSGLRPVIRLAAAVGRVASIVREDAILRMAHEYDVIWLTKVTSPSFISRLRKATSARIVLDLVDAIWLGARDSDRLSTAIQSADWVTTDNDFTAGFLGRYHAHCTVIPDPPQVECFDRRRGQVAKRQGRTTIGWIGSPQTLYNLYEAWSALELLFREFPGVELRLIGAGRDKRLIPPFENVRYTTIQSYTQPQMVDEALALDIGIFPLQATDASRARGVLKATVYMAGQAAVVASPVGTVGEVVRPGETGLLAHTGDDWLDALRTLVTDRVLREGLAARGLELVRREFSLERCFDKLHGVLEAVSSRKEGANLMQNGAHGALSRT
jgi:glycosyltransferase involved in cell wall biosynthesis